jgi:hypothetical protein
VTLHASGGGQGYAISGNLLYAHGGGRGTMNGTRDAIAAVITFTSTRPAALVTFTEAS